jgi:glycosyltransferase involved in cell wall biosynthesis
MPYIISAPKSWHPMRILHVYRTYSPPGGTQEAIRNLCLATRDYGVQSRVFTLSSGPCPAEITLPEGKVVFGRSWGAPASCDIGGFSAVRAFMREAAWADLVHFHFPWPYLDLLRFMLPRGKPCLMTYHSDIVRQRKLAALYAPLMRHTLRAMPRIVVGSANYVESSETLRACVEPEKLRVIPFGLVERSEPAPEGRAILDRLGVPRGGYFLALSVLRYYKGLHHLVRAALAVDAPIVIAGAGYEETNLRALATELGVKNIVFAGHVSEDEKTVLLGNCRAFVFPSHLRSEAFGLALVEAAMTAKPMISCEIGTGTSFVNRDGETGLVVPPSDPVALAAAMNQLLSDPALCARFGAAARQRYETYFTAQGMGEKYTALYRDLVPVGRTDPMRASEAVKSSGPLSKQIPALNERCAVRAE